MLEDLQYLMLKHSVIKTIRYWHKDRAIKQNRESRSRPTLRQFLIKTLKQNNGEKTVLSTNGAVEMHIHMKKN